MGSVLTGPKLLCKQALAFGCQTVAFCTVFFTLSPSSIGENRNWVSNMYTSPLSPPIPLAFSDRNLQTTTPTPKLPKNQSNSGEASPGITQVVPEKETWPVDDLTNLDLKKQNRETIDECPICLEEYETENPKLLTKCGHDFHLSCILEWMERSEACPVCDKELVLTES